MLKSVLLEMFERELLKLRVEILEFKNEADLWKTPGDISNSAGNLCLHLCGNLQHFIGAKLGKTGYIRDRPFEFEAKNVPREKLISEIEITAKTVRECLEKMPTSDFNALYPEEKHGKIITVDYMLVHLLAHLNYHLGQINYYRRIF